MHFVLLLLLASLVLAEDSTPDIPKDEVSPLDHMVLPEAGSFSPFDLYLYLVPTNKHLNRFNGRCSWRYTGDNGLTSTMCVFPLSTHSKSIDLHFFKTTTMLAHYTVINNVDSLVE